MIDTLASVSFAFPAALWALLALPVIWWLLRFTPPKPQRIAFPPFRLLRELMSTEEQPDRTPWWLILLRLALAGLIILAVARPMLGANEVGLGNARPLLIVLDDGWAAARDWQKRVNYLSDIIGNGEQQGRLM
ncbi:MAG: BatA domain-containing protein, partial [Aestuariivirgaceae bacterium]